VPDGTLGFPIEDAAMSIDPQLDLLLRFLERLKPCEISWRLSPNGALLQRSGRMVAMLLVQGMKITISPKDGEDESFELEFGEEDQAIEFIQFLAGQTTATLPGQTTADVLDILA
jgi:hypothetical protein